MEILNHQYSSRQRVCGLDQLLQKPIVSGRHLHEVDGRLEAAPAPRADELSVTIRPDAGRSSMAGMEHVFLPTQETASSRLLASWHRGGLAAVLEDLASDRRPGSLPGWLGRLASFVSALLRLPYTASIVSQARRPTVPLIKHRLQRRVADLHWK
ncbi:uncharacterized protein LOC119106132 [Pollicipes pollicipes]|uniref:uncharacterized protein LOC119106132 n=1 Tax=Pollicipes pollicipes TaxID=41117 RepID=UPI001884A9FB|nr:uncharacterized protein LOC119106132 [Pollicipes pollicipes]